jgi:hypothetical protein
MQVPHEAIGSARRIVVPPGDCQGAIMLEALVNHNPRCIIVDELCHERDVRAACSICQRGVALVATAHAPSLAALLTNPTLDVLVGGTQPVILSDMDARMRPRPLEFGRAAPWVPPQAVTKSRLERKGSPLFRIIVEMLGDCTWRIHWDTAASVDALLLGQQPPAEIRSVKLGVLKSHIEGE